MFRGACKPGIPTTLRLAKVLLPVISLLSALYICAHSEAGTEPSTVNRGRETGEFSVNLVIGGVIRVNADFDEKNRNEEGNPLADYQPDAKEGHRITPDDPNLMDAALSVEGTGKGKWRLIYPDKIKVWLERDSSAYEEFDSSWYLESGEASISCDFKIEGISGSELTNDVKILAEFVSAESGETYRDSVFLTVLETQFAVTFDDGPLPEKTDKIVRALTGFYHDGKPVKAAFFHIGVKIEKFGDLTRFAHKHGHLVLNHTYRHADFGYRMLNNEEIRDDILLCEEAIYRALAKEPVKIIRSRALREDGRFEKEAGMMGYRFCTGELLDDWEAESIEEIQTRAEEVLESWNTREDPRLHPYPSILIFHEFPELICDHVGEIISHLQDRGFVLVDFDPDLIY